MEEWLRDMIENAHMAGQNDAGVDAGYSNARAYCNEIENTRPTPDSIKDIEWVGECDDCNGTGSWGAQVGAILGTSTCQECNGTGQITRQATLEEVIRVARSLTITANKKDWSCVQEFIEALDQALAIDNGRLRIKE